MPSVVKCTHEGRGHMNPVNKYLPLELISHTRRNHRQHDAPFSPFPCLSQEGFEVWGDWEPIGAVEDLNVIFCRANVYHHRENLRRKKKRKIDLLLGTGVCRFLLTDEPLGKSVDLSEPIMTISRGHFIFVGDNLNLTDDHHYERR